MAENGGKISPEAPDQLGDLPENLTEIVWGIKQNVAGRWKYETDGLAYFGLLSPLEEIGAVPPQPKYDFYGTPAEDATEEEQVAWEVAHPEETEVLYVAQQWRDQVMTAMYLGAMAHIMNAEDLKQFPSPHSFLSDYSSQSLRSYFREMYIQGYVNYYRQIVQPDSRGILQMQQAGIISATQNPYLPHSQHDAFRKWQIDHDQFLDPAQQYAYYSLGKLTVVIMANMDIASPLRADL